MDLEEDLKEQNRLLKEQLQSLKDRRGIDQDILDDSRDYTNVLADQVKQVKFQVSEKKQLSSLNNSISRLAQDLYSTTKDELGTKKQIKDLDGKKEKLLKSQISLKSLIGKFTELDGESQVEINNSIIDQIGNTQKLLKEIEEIEKTSKGVANTFGVKLFSSLNSITSAIPGLKEFATPFEEAAEASRKTAISNLEAEALEEKRTQNLENYGKLLKKGNKIKEEDIKALGLEGQFLDKNGKLIAGGSAYQRAKKLNIEESNKSFKKQSVLLSGIKKLASTMFKGLFIDSLLGADKAIGSLAKSMGTSYSQSVLMREELHQIGRNSFDVFVTTKNLQESLVELNKEFGTATMFSGEMLKDFTQLTKRAGYSAEAISKISKLTTLTGTDLSDNTSLILGQARAYNAVNKVAINEKQIVEDVAKTSAATTLTLGKNPKLIASANIAARALGTSLEKVENIASSLLSFETSIANELEAELMIGKELNLEVAREAALRGEVGKVAEEVAKQVGTSAEFGAMNVLQQEALAKAVGMTREDLAKSLMEREALVKLGTQDKDLQSAYNTLKKQGLSDDQIANKLGDEALANQLKSVSVQERLTATVEKLKELFIGIAQPILQIISPIVDILAPALSGIAYLLTPIIVAFEGLGKMLTGNFDKLSGWEVVLGSIAGIMLLIKTRQFLINKATLKKIGYEKTGQGLLLKERAIKAINYLNDKRANAENLTSKTLIGNLSIKNSLKEMGFKLRLFALEKAAFITEKARILFRGVQTTLQIGKELAVAAARTIASYAAIPVIGVPLGIAAAAGLAALVYNYMDDGMQGPVKNGYSRTMYGPEGAISFNDKDTIIAGTDLGGGNANSPNRNNINPQNGGPENSQLIAEVRQMNATLKQLLQKDTNIEIDGTILNKKVQQSLSPLG